MASWLCSVGVAMYKYEKIKTELNLLFESFKENKRLYFLTHFSGILSYVLVLALNFYWNPFYAGAFDLSGDSLFERLLWSNFYLGLWYAPALLVYVLLMNFVVDLIGLKRINIFFRNLIGFIGCTIQNSMTPLMLGNLIFLHFII